MAEACTITEETFGTVKKVTWAWTSAADGSVGAAAVSTTTTNAYSGKIEMLVTDPGATAPGDTGIVRSIIAAHASADTATPIVGYRGKKRYVKCTPVFGGTHGTGTLVGVIAERGHAYHGPIGASSVET